MAKFSDLSKEEKDRLLSIAKKDIASGGSYKGKTPQQVAQTVTKTEPKKTTSKKTTSSGSSSKKTSSAKSSTNDSADARPVGARIPTFLQPKSTSKVAPIISSPSGLITPINGNSALDTLRRNSLLWHKTSDSNERERLFQQNNKIRQQYGLQYDSSTGNTYMPTENGLVDLTEPIARYTGATQAPTSEQYSYEEKMQRYNDLQAEIERMQKQYPYLLAQESFDNPVSSIAYFATNPEKAKLREQGVYALNRMNSTQRKNADALYELYKQIVDEANSLSSEGAGIGFALKNTGLNVAGAVEGVGRTISGYTNKALGDLAWLLGGAKDNSVSDFFHDTAEETLGNSVTGNALDNLYRQSKVVGGTKTAAELAGSASRMVPAIAANVALPGSGSAVILGDASSSATRQALNDGASLSQAAAYGAMSGLTDLGTEKLFGGIPGLPNGAIRVGGTVGKALDIAGEGAEEAISAIADPYLRRMTYDQNAQNATAEDIKNAAIGGALLSSIMQFGYHVPSAIENAVSARNRSKSQIKNAKGEQTLDSSVNQSVSQEKITPTIQQTRGRGNDVITPDVLYAAENGQIASQLPSALLPAGRDTQTSIGERVTNVETYPRLSVDDGGVSNGGITDSAARYAQELYNAQQRSGVNAAQIAQEIVQPVTDEYNSVLSGTEQYMRDYRGQGTVVVRNDEYGGSGYRASQNDSWYSDFYKKNGRAPRKNEIPSLAVQTVNSEIQRGGGQFVSSEFAQRFREAQQVQEAASILGSDTIRLQNTKNGLEVTRGTPARTADIRTTNAGMNYVSEPEYGNPAQPLSHVQPIVRNPQPQNPVVSNNPANPSVGAADYNFDPYTRMENEYGTIAPGESPRAREVDVPLSTDGNDRVRRFARTAMEAEATPEQMIPEFEQNVANGLFSYNPIKNKDSLNKAVRTISEKGFDGALAQWEDVTSGRRTATADDIVLAEMMYSSAAKNGDTQLAMQLAAEIAAEGTRAGQAVQALRLLKRTTPDGKLYYIRKAVDNIQKNLDEQRGKKAPKLKIDEGLANNLLNATDDAKANDAIEQIYNDVASQIPPTFGDRLNAWRYFAMLGNPRTHIRNVVGNIVMQIPTRASNKISAIAQKALPKEQRTRSVTRNRAAKDFAKSDYEEMKNVISGNSYTSEMSEVQQRQRIYPKPLQAVMDLNTKALDAEDTLFKRITYINSMADYLTARGVDVNNIDPNVLEQARTHAIEDARRATFQDASDLADAIGKIENKNKATKLAIGGLLPFKRTPINIAKRGFEYSPAGLIKSMTYDLAQVKKGKMSATDFIDNVSQGLTGTSIAAIGYFLASNGLISASSPENDKERNFEAAQGSQEYALNIGDMSYTIDWAAPGALPLFIGAEFFNATQQKYGDDEQVFKQAMDSISRLFEPMVNMTMLSGLSSTIQSASYSQSNPIVSMAGNIVSNYAGQVVPTLFGQIARTIDDTRRTTYANKDSWVPDNIQTFLQRQANKIPGLSQKQPAYTDVFGREDKTDNVVLRAFENFLSPGYISSTDTSATEQALSELYRITGDTSVLPSKPQKYYTENEKDINLTANQWLKLSNEKGSISLDALNNLFQSSAYQNMSDQEKINAVKDIYDYASQVSANSVYGKELEGTIKNIHDSGIDPGLYYAYKEMEDTLNETEESYAARDSVFQTIRGDASLSDEQKNQLYETLLMEGTSDSQYEKYQEIKNVVSAEEYVDAMIQYQAIKAYGDELEEGRATAEATEFSYYLDTMGYTGEKRDALENTFKYYNMFPAEPSNYTFDMLRENGSNNEKDNASAIESSGVTAPQYLAIKSLASDAQYTKGETGAKLRAYAKVVSENTETYEQYAAIMHAMGYKKIEDAYTGAGTLPEATAGTSQVSRSTSSSSFVNPTKAENSVVTSKYGNRNAPKTSGGYGSTNHGGIDIGGTGGNLNGQEADTIGSGTVETVGNDPNGYGNYVIINHGNGYKTLYGHLQKATVQQGQKVFAGQQIGVIGSTGNSSAPHLHLSAWYNDKEIDPLTIIPGY